MQEEITGVAHLLADNFEDEKLRAHFVDLTLQLVEEQPLKTPFAAAVVLVVNTLVHKPVSAMNGKDDGLDTSMENDGQEPQEPQPTSPVVDDLLVKAAAAIEEKINLGEWRAVKLYLKLLACLQSCLEGDGVFPILEDLFSQAVELQTNNNEDVSLPMCVLVSWSLGLGYANHHFLQIVDGRNGTGQDHPPHITIRRCFGTWRGECEIGRRASGQDRGHCW